MARNITVRFADGTTHVYANAPDNITPAAVAARATKEFNKPIVGLDGGKNPPPVTTKQQDIQATARQAVQAKAAQPGGSFLGSLYRGVRDGIPGISYVDAAANELGSKVGLNKTDPNMSYTDRVRAIQANNDTAETNDKASGFLPTAAHYVGEGVGAIGAGAAAKVGLAAKGLAGVGALQKGQTFKNVMRLAAGGAVGGAVYGAGSAMPGSNAHDALTGAATGAILSPVAGLAAPAVAGAVVKGARGLARPYSNSLGSALREVVKEDPSAIAGRAAAIGAKTGAPVPVVAALNPQDFAAVSDKVINQHPDALAAAKGSAASYIAGMKNRMLSHVNAAGKAFPGDPDGALQTSIGDLSGMRQSAADDAMAPIRDHQIDISKLPLSDIEAGVTKSIGGRIQGGDMDTSLGQRLRTALAPIDPQKLRDAGVEPGDVDASTRNLLTQWGMKDPVPATIGELDQLRRTLGAAGNSSINSNPANSLAFRNAANSIRQYIQDEAPDSVGKQYGDMIDTYAAHSRMLEGFKTAVNGQGIGDIEDNLLRGNLATSEGKAGLAMGELARQRAAVSSTPGAIQAAGRYADRGAVTGPSSIVAGAPDPGTVTANLGDQAAAGLANASEGEKTVLDRMLATDKVNQMTANADEHSLGPMDLLHGAMMSHALPTTKIRFISKLAGAVTGLNPNVASNIADKLYSGNPEDIKVAMDALGRAGLGEKTVQGLMQTAQPVAAVANTMYQTQGTTGAQPDAQTPPEQDPAAAPAPVDQIPPEQDPAAAPAPTIDVNGVQGTPPNPNGYVYPDDANPTAGPVDPAKSPYMAPLQHIYDNEDPRVLDFIDTLNHKESRGQQFDKDGKPLVSSAGAVGTMQLEPGTARDVAQSKGLPWNPSALHNDPAYNKLLGYHYAVSMLDKFGGDPQKAAAAYNAGPGRVNHAIQTAGDNWLAATPAETQQYAGDVG